MTDIIQSFSDRNQRHQIDKSSYAKELAERYPNIDAGYVIQNNVPNSALDREDLEAKKRLENLAGNFGMRDGAPTPPEPVSADPNDIFDPNAEIQEDALYTKTPQGQDFAAASRVMYNKMFSKDSGSGFAYRGIALPMFSDREVPQTDEDFARFGVEFMGQFNYNITKMGIDVAKLQGLDENTALAFYSAMTMYDRLPDFTWNGTKRMTQGIASDPTTIAGLGTLGWAFLGRAGAKQTTKTAFKEYLKSTLASSTAVGAIEGGVYGGLDNYFRQQVAVDAEIQDGINLSELGTAVTVGTLAGGVLGKTTDVLGDAVSKAVPFAQDVAKNVGEELQTGAMFSNPVGVVVDAAIKAFDQPKENQSRIAEIALERNPLPEGKTPKIVVDDLQKYFDEIALQKNGKKLNITENAEDFETVKAQLISDIATQSRADVSGKGWYDDDIFKSITLLSRIPGFEDLRTNETRRVILSAVLGATSPGPKVAQNTRSGSAQYLQWSQTGAFSTEAPPPGTAVAGIQKAGFGQYGYPDGLRMVQHLIDKFGEDGFADFMLSPHTRGELTALRKEAGFKSGPAGMSGKTSSMHFGAAILGDKAGKFMLNINGYPSTTKDKWFVRSIRRFEGTFGDNLVNQKGKLVELGQPKNVSERQAMDRLVEGAIASPELSPLKLTEQDAQAILWFREQNLYNDLGVRSVPQTFSEGVEAVGGQEGFGIRGSDEIKTALEQGTAELPDFRNVSAGQRAIRADRRRQLAQLNNPERDAAASGPYSTGSAGDAGRAGRLEANEQTRSRYEAAGLRIPNIEIKTAAEADQYATDISTAMAEHRFGAQVEVKSAEDLSSYKMYRTEDGGGFSLKPDGDIVAVFQPKGAPKGGIYAVLQAAIAQGGKKLDAFNTMLPDIYETVGFRPVARVKWNDEYAPKPPFAAKAWDKEVFKKYNNGEPDVVLFVYDENYFGGESINDLPIFDDFDDASAVQEQALKDLDTAAKNTATVKTSEAPTPEAQAAYDSVQTPTMQYGEEAATSALQSSVDSLKEKAASNKGGSN